MESPEIWRALKNTNSCLSPLWRRIIDQKTRHARGKAANVKTTVMSLAMTSSWFNVLTRDHKFFNFCMVVFGNSLFHFNNKPEFMNIFK